MMRVFMCRVVEFSDEPAGMMLYEGVFFSRSQAESYLIAHSHSVPDDNLQHHHKCTVTHSMSVFDRYKLQFCTFFFRFYVHSF